MTLRDEIGSLALSVDERTAQLSLGVAIFPDHASDAAAIAKAADVALYQAKCAGRDRVVMFAEKAEPIPLQGS